MRFRLNQVDQAELWRQVQERTQQAQVEDDERATLWALGYRASQQMSPVDRVVALESPFRGRVESPLELFRLPVDLLWRAYQELLAQREAMTSTQQELLSRIE